MSENVFNVVQLGFQSGTFEAPGSAVAATVLLPISERISPELTLGGAYPALDRGRNVRNMGGSGYKGVRSAAVTVPSEVRFEDIILWLELIYGHVDPTGAFTWLYPFETGASSCIPATIETGNIDTAAAQERIVSCLIDSLTMGFSAITAGQASPWTLSAQLLGFTLESNALTGSLSGIDPILETVQGHLTQLYQGPIATPFADLPELAGSLRSFTMTANRNLRLRAYGGTTDLATKFGFGDLSTATYEMVVAVNADSQSDLHDVWNTSGGVLGEKRIRVKATGSASKLFTIDALAGMFAVPWDDSDGERVYKISGEFADDTDLDASHTIEVVNTIAALP